MSTTTPHFGLVLPDGTDPIARTTQINGNFSTVDTLARAIICTSGTQPSSPFAGQTIFETDTRLLRVRNDANNAWTTVANLVQHVTSSTRPASPAANQMIYETDTRALVVRNSANTFWYHVTGIPIVTSTALLDLFYTNQIVYDTSVPGLRRYNGTTWEIWDPNTQWKYKSTNESVTSSTTLQNDDTFSFTVVANAAYAVEGYCVIDGIDAPAGGLKSAFVGPAGASVFFTNFGSTSEQISGLTLYNMVAQGIGATRNQATNGVSVPMSFQPKATLVIGATAGTVNFQWAQVTSNATPTRILGGSWMKATRIA